MLFLLLYAQLWIQHIDSYIPRDLKHTRDISDSIIDYLKFPYFFSINFVFEDIKDFEKCYISHKDKKCYLLT